MKYERQITRLARMIWGRGLAYLYVGEKGPVARRADNDGKDGVLVGVYSEYDAARVLQDIEETKLELGIRTRTVKNCKV